MLCKNGGILTSERSDLHVRATGIAYSARLQVWQVLQGMKTVWVPVWN